MTQQDLFSGDSRAEAEPRPRHWEPPPGPPEYRAAVHMVHHVPYTKLNAWQREYLWPHLRYFVDHVMPRAGDDPGRLSFELGYLVGSLEVEQLRSRTDALAICAEYGVTSLGGTY